MIRITNFNVGQGDCLLLHFESPNIEGKKLYFNLLIDGGYAKNNIYQQIEKVLNKETLNGIVITHIDGDHIAGSLKMMDASKIVSNGTFVIFNKYDESLISYRQGKKLANMIKEKFGEELLYKSYAKSYAEEDNSRINTKLDKNSNLIVNLMSFTQRKKTIALCKEKVNITLLGPDHTVVKQFMRNWHNNNVEPKVINKSSITLLIEFMNHTILLPGDAYFTDFISKLDQIGIKHIDIIKASHHGAKENNIGLLKVVEDYKCKEVIFTIKGEWDKKHPDLELVEELSNKSKLSCAAILQEDSLKNKIETKEKVILGE